MRDCWQGSIFTPLPLSELAPRVVNHLHVCAMLVRHLEPDEMQPAIMDYIITLGENAPSFLLDRVPLYAAGYNQAEYELRYRPNDDGS